MEAILNLSNASSRDSIHRLSSDVEGLRGGFGNGSDEVGSSYQNFYLDSYNAMSNLSAYVDQESALCDRVRPIDPDKLCRRGFNLINSVKNYPKV